MSRARRDAHRGWNARAWVRWVLSDSYRHVFNAREAAEERHGGSCWTCTRTASDSWHHARTLAPMRRAYYRKSRGHR